MKLAEVLSRDCIRTGVTASSKDQVLQLIAETLTASGRLPEELSKRVYQELRHREEIGSTGFGNGAAIPHCRVNALEDFLAGMLVIQGKGVDFDSVDGEPVRIVPYLVGPADRSRGHLSLLSSIAQLLRSRDVRRELAASESPDEVFAILTEDSSEADAAGEGVGGQREMRLMHVFVQDEEVFDQVLQVFAAAENFSTMVLEAHESTDYLARTPLFAGFWDAEMQTFNRVIVATVKAELVNAVIRNIEFVCGKLDQRDGIMVTVAPLLQVSGSLGM